MNKTEMRNSIIQILKDEYESVQDKVIDKIMDVIGENEVERLPEGYYLDENDAYEIKKWV